MNRQTARDLVAELDQEYAVLESELISLRTQVAAIEAKMISNRSKMVSNRSLKQEVGKYFALEELALDTAFGSKPGTESAIDNEAGFINRRSVAVNGPKLSRADLIADVLFYASSPLTISDMRGPMRARNYGKDMADNIMYNSIYTALKKWEDRFERDLSGTMWQLTKEERKRQMEARQSRVDSPSAASVDG